MTFDDHAAADLNRTREGRVCTAIAHARMLALLEGCEETAEALRMLELRAHAEAAERPMRIGGGVR